MIDTQSLRTKILDMAVRGNLYPKNQNLSTVNDLLMQITKRKEYLIKANVLKREKQLPTISDTEIPYELPDHWQWVRLGDYAEKVTDYVASGSFQSLRENAPSLKTKNYAILVKTADFSNGFTKNLTYTTERGYNFLENSNLYGGELILSNIGSIGKVFIVPKLNQKMTLAPNSVMIRLTEEGLRDYLYYFLLSPAGYRALDMISSGTAVKKFNKTSLKTILLPIPPVEEQRQIVCKVKELFCQLDIIDELQKQYAYNITSLNKKILDQAVMGKLVPQDPTDEPASVLLKKIAEEKQKLIKEGKIKKQKALPAITEDEIPFEIPESWKWVRLNEIIENVPANGFSPKGVDYQTDYKNLTLTATTSGTFKADAFKYVDITKEQAEKYFLKEDDILIQRSNSRELVGTACLYTEGPDKYIYPDLMMRIHALDGIWPQYLVMTLQSPYVRGYYQQNASGSSQSMPKINQSIVGNTLIPIPPLHEQKKIFQTVNRLIPTLSSLC